MRSKHSKNPPCPGSKIAALEIEGEGLVWAGLDVLSICWDVRTIPIDGHGSTARISGYALATDDGRTRFVPAHKVKQIIKTQTG
jgi:hypothetical protein